MPADRSGSSLSYRCRCKGEGHRPACYFADKRVKTAAEIEAMLAPTLPPGVAPDYRAALDRAEELLRRCAQIVTMIREGEHDLGCCKSAVDELAVDLCTAGYGAPPGPFWTAPARKDSDVR